MRVLFGTDVSSVSGGLEGPRPPRELDGSPEEPSGRPSPPSGGIPGFGGSPEEGDGSWARDPLTVGEHIGVGFGLLAVVAGTILVAPTVALGTSIAWGTAVVSGLIGNTAGGVR